MKHHPSRTLKRTLVGVFAAALVLLPVASTQELLRDPGFEQSTPNGTFPDSGAWQKAWLFRAGATCTLTAARSGTSGLWQYTGEDRSSWWAGQYQEIEAPPGAVFTARAWVRTPPGEGWVPGSKALVRVEFHRSSGQPALHDSPAVTGVATDWQLLEIVTPPTPADIQRVRLVLYLEKPASATGISVANFDDASLTVSRETGAPWIVAAPATQTVPAGASVSLAVVANGAPPFAYAWYFNGVPVAGVHGHTLTIPSATAADAGEYAVQVSNPRGSVWSTSATLTVLDRSGAVLVLDQIPAHGSTANLIGRALNVSPAEAKVACAVGVPGIWSKPTFANPTVALQPDGSWTVDVTTGGIDHLATRLYAWLVPAAFDVPLLGGAGSVPAAYPDAALASVVVVRDANTTFDPPTILTPPENVSLPPGGSAAFAVVAADDGSTTYQWYRGAAAIAGATKPMLTLPNVKAADAGRYSVAVRSSAGSESRVSALLEVEAPMAPTIVSQPESWAALPGESVRFKVVASGTTPLTYEWRRDGVRVEGGSTAELFLGGVASKDAGLYQVFVRNAAGETSSRPVRLTVVEGQEPALVITSVPEYGEVGHARGRVFHVDPANHAVVTGIFLPGLGWYAKATCAELLAPLAPDGTFAVNVATGGIDPEATLFAGYVVPKDTAVICFQGVDCIPAEIGNLALAQSTLARPNPAARTIEWSGENWRVKPGAVPVGPGPNFFSDSTDNVWVDDLGRLHLKLTRRGGQWQCAEIINTRPLGYGRYVIEVESALDFPAPQVIFGFFSWSDGCPHREIDFEAGRFGNAGDANALQFVVQPWDQAGHLRRFRAGAPGPSTHSFLWGPGIVHFRSVHGDQVLSPPPEAVLQDWTFADPSSVPEPGDETIRLNLWLFNGQPPANGAETEVIVRAFKFLPRLEVQRVGETIQVSWAATLTDYVLERSSALVGPWTPVDSTPTVQDDRLIVTEPMTAATAYFRLHRPTGR